MLVLKQIIKYLLKLLNILIIVLTFGLIFISIFKKEWLELAIEWMRLKISILGYWNYAIAFLSSGIEAFPVLGGFLPGTNILLIVGGFFGQVNKFNLIFLIIFASIGAIIGNYIGYLLGVKYGEVFFEKYGLWVGIGKTEAKYLKKGIEKWGAVGIIAGKFHATTRTFLPFIAGATGMKSGKFMIYNAIGSVIRSCLIVVLGVFFVNYYKFILAYAGYILGGILLLIFGYLYFFKREGLMQYIKEKNAEIEEQTNKK